MNFLSSALIAIILCVTANFVQDQGLGGPVFLGKLTVPELLNFGAYVLAIVAVFQFIQFIISKINYK